MALAQALAGHPLHRDTNSVPLPLAPTPGATVSVTSSASSQNVALPQDANGTQYSGVRITASGGVWLAFCTAASDAVVASTSPAILVQSAAYMDLSVPEGAKYLAVLWNGSAFIVNVIGIY